MGHNLKQQMFNAIDKSFRPGESKRTSDDIRREESIYSYQYKNNLKDLSSNFASYMKDKHSDVKMLRDIKEEHIQGFLKEKESKVSSATLQTYKSGLEKIGVCASNVYNSKINMKCEYKAEQKDKIRSIAMSESDYNKLMKATEDKQCKSRVAVEVCRAFGLRVSEVIKIRESDIKSNVLHIHESKGGRSRDIQITSEKQKEALSKLLEYKQGNKKPILDIKADSVNKWVKSNMNKIGITKYSDNKTGVHSIRKMYAQERYTELRNQGYEHKKAWGIVSVELGHSEDRMSLFKVYCPNL